MQAECGVVRTSRGLCDLTDQILAFAESTGPANELVCAELIVSSAYNREESRGGHYRSDFPEPGETAERQYRQKGSQT